MSGWLVGVDAGGTSTRALAAQPDGGELRQGRGDGANWTVHGAVLAGERVRAVVEQAVPAGEPVAAVCVCAAGFYPPDHGESARAWLAATWSGAIAQMATDVLAAWAGAHGGEPGIVVISGTGSIAFGRSAAGDEARAGGWGPLFSDQGSAYRVGLDALRALADVADGIREPSSLQDRFLGAWPGLGSDPTTWLRGIYREKWGREQLAALAAEVAEVAGEGEALARELIDRAAEDLHEMAGAVRRRLGAERLPLAVQGGLGTSPVLQEALRARLTSDASLGLVEPRLAPVEGALLLAAESWGGRDARQRLLERLPAAPAS